MGDSEGLVDQEALESNITNEEVPEEKPNSEINEESNNESTEAQESGVAVEEEKGEAQELTTADNEAEEESQNPNQQLDIPGEEEKGDTQELTTVDEVEEKSEEPNQQVDVPGEEEKGDTQELTTADNEVEEKSEDPNQQLDVPGEEEKEEAQEKTTADNEAKEQPQNPNQMSSVPAIQSSAMRQQSHVKSKQSLSFQNSPSSIVHHTPQQAKSHMPLTNVVSVSDSRPRINPRTGKEIQSHIAQTSSVWEKIPLAKVLCPSWTAAQGNEVIEWEMLDPNEVVVHTEGCQPLADEAENGDQPPAGTESKHSGQVVEETGSQCDQPPPQDEESGQNDHPTGEASPQQPGDQQPVASDVSTVEDAVRVSQKSGKPIRDSTIQTSLIWEKKPLAQILLHSGNKADSPDSSKKTKDQNSFFNWPDPFEF